MEKVEKSTLRNLPLSYFTPISIASMKKKLINKQLITSAGEDVEKLESSCIIGEIIKWYSHCGRQYGGSSKN